MGLLEELDRPQPVVQQKTPTLLESLDTIPPEPHPSLLSTLDTPFETPQPRKSTFQNVLEQVNRTGFGGVNLVRNYIRASKRQEKFDPVGAFAKGFSLQETPVFGEVLTEDLNFRQFLTSVGIEPSSPTGRVATGVMGFAGDVLLDPLTYVPAGVFLKAMKGASRVTGVTAGASALARTEPVQALGRAFVPGFVVRKTFPALYQESRHFEALMKTRQADVVEETLGLAKGFSPDEARTIRRILDEPGFTASGLDPRLTETAETIRQKFQAFAEVEQKAGVLHSVREFYFPHIKKDVEQIIGSPTVTSLKKVEPFFAKQRTIEQSIEAVNQQLAREFFEENAFKGLGIRGLAHAKAVTMAEFLNKTLSEYGRRAKIGDTVGTLEGVYASRDLFRRSPQAFLAANFKALQEGNQLVELGGQAAEHLIRTTKGAEVWILPKEIAEFMNTYRRGLTNDQSLRTFLRGYDGVLNLWKGYTTGANFPFHARNFISNYWLNFLRHGSTAFDPVANTQAMGVLLANSRQVRKTFPVLAQTLENRLIQTPTGALTYKQVFQLMRENGISGRGWLGTDIPSLVDQQLSVGLADTTKKVLSRLNPVSQQNALLRTGRILGENIENHARALSFIGGLKRGEDVGTSALLTKKFLFDYSELTPFEQRVMKRIVPFYTWMRKNIPLQFEQFLKQPAKYTALFKAEREAERGIAVPTDMPDWIRSGVPIFASEEAKGRPIAFFLRNYIPAADIQQVIGSPVDLAGQRVPELVRTMITSLSPAIREPVEQALNFDVFLNRPIERFPGEQQTVAGVSVPRRLARLAPRPLTEISRILGEPGRREEDVPFGVRATRAVTGLKGYPVDVQRNVRIQRFKQEEIRRELKAAIKSAIRRGDMANVRAARTALQRLQ